MPVMFEILFMVRKIATTTSHYVHKYSMYNGKFVFKEGVVGVERPTWSIRGRVA